MRSLVLCSCECSVCLSMVCVVGYVYMCHVYYICEFVCLLGIPAQVHYCLVLETWSCANLASVGQLNLSVL